MKSDLRRLQNVDGLTLVELMVALFISSILMFSVYLTYLSQHKAYTVQDQVTDMQQNLRAAMFHLEREVRMAGCDPSGDAGAGIIIADVDSLSFSMDINDDSDNYIPDDDISDSNEQIAYALDDPDGDGVDDELDRNNNTLAENIEVLNFVYLDGDGNVLDDDGLGNVVGRINDIRSVQITIVARTGRSDRDFTNSKAYKNLQGVTIFTAPGDHIRRRSLSRHVRCRNLGLI